MRRLDADPGSPTCVTYMQYYTDIHYTHTIQLYVYTLPTYNTMHEINVHSLFCVRPRFSPDAKLRTAEHATLAKQVSAMGLTYHQRSVAITVYPCQGWFTK